MKGTVALLLISACSYSFTGGFHSGGGGGGSTAPSGSSGGGESSARADGPQSGPALWRKWAVRGVTLGLTDRKGLKAQGFQCGKYPNQRCFKLMDKRCDAGRCEFKEDAFGQWFELDGAKTDLEYMTVATTDTDSAVVYDIRLFTVPRVVLEPASPFGKALYAKYGTPVDISEPSSEDKVGGGRMVWWNKDLGNNGPEVIADCSSTTSKGCDLDVSDSQVLQGERSKQQTIDAQRKRNNQPSAAPQL